MVPHRPTPGNLTLQHSLSYHSQITRNLQADNGATAAAHPDLADALADLLRHDVDTWTERGLRTIKERTVRRVFRGELAGLDVHVKVFRADTIAARARDALRTGKGEREAHHLLLARERRLPALEPLAYGHAVLGEHLGSFLVTRTVRGDDFAFPADADDARRTGALLRRVHDLGLAPGDLHPGNVLVTADGPVLGDLTSFPHAGELSLRRRAAALAFFCNPIDGGPLDAQCRAFLRGYEQAGDADRLPRDRFHAELARATRQLRATAVRSFGRRGMRSCRHTDAEPRRRATPRWFWHLPADGRDLRAACAAFDPDATPPRRSGRRGAVWLTDDLAIKRRDAGKAKKLWQATYWLMFARVPIATPVALRLCDGHGQVFVRRLANDDLRTELAEGRVDLAAIAATARALGRAIGRLHAHGLRNRDLKFDNIVRDAASGDVHLVDLDGVTLHAAEDTRGCGRDLGRLLAAFHNADRPGGDATVRRFVRAYLRTRRRLLQDPPMARILLHAERRAREWRERHTGQTTSQPDRRRSAADSVEPGPNAT